MRRAGLIFFGVPAMAAVASAQPGVVESTFDTDNEGWLLVDLNPGVHTGNPMGSAAAPWDGGNGQPPGSLHVGDVFSWTFARAPAKFLGNFSASYGLAMECDFYVTFRDSNVVYPVFAIVGDVNTLYFSVPVNDIPTGTWFFYSVPLEAGWWRLNHYESGPMATEAEVKGVLADVKDVFICTEYNTGPDETWVDNVVFGVKSSCYPDCDESGTLDLFDFLCFVNEFNNGSSYADCDGSGGLDLFDFLCFVNEFNLGCP